MELNQFKTCPKHRREQVGKLSSFLPVERSRPFFSTYFCHFFCFLAVRFSIQPQVASWKTSHVTKKPTKMEHSHQPFHVFLVLPYERRSRRNTWHSDRPVAAQKKNGRQEYLIRNYRCSNATGLVRKGCEQITSRKEKIKMAKKNNNLSVTTSNFSNASAIIKDFSKCMNQPT